jgi:hypothetical protein
VALLALAILQRPYAAWHFGVSFAAQQTLLTMFVPTVPGDIGLDARIDSILADVDDVFRPLPPYSPASHPYLMGV